MRYSILKMSFCSPVKYGLAGSNLITLPTVLLQSYVLLSQKAPKAELSLSRSLESLGGSAGILRAHGTGENTAQSQLGVLAGMSSLFSRKERKHITRIITETKIKTRDFDCTFSSL